MFCSFCYILSNRSLFYSFWRWWMGLQSSWSESRVRDILFYSIQIIIILSELLTVMIYMRERISKKKRQGAELTKRLIFDEIKFKITQGIQPTEKKQIEDKGKNTGENQVMGNVRPIYQISKNTQQRKDMQKMVVQRLSQSIVVENGKSESVCNIESRKRRTQSIQKCFDIQIVNMLGSTVKFEAFIKVLEGENKQLKQSVQSLQSELQRKEQLNIQNNQSKMKEIQFKYLQESVKNTEKDELISKYQRYFEEGKNILLKVSMELIEAKNSLGITLTPQRLAEKHQQLSRCLEKSEKMISIYSHFLQEWPRGAPKQGLILEELSSIIKCQQRTIEKLTDSKKKDGQLCRENVLLRYETNRLSKQNEELLGMLSEARSEKSKQQWQSIKRKSEGSIVLNEQLSSFCQTENLEQTPINKLTEIKRRVGSLDMIDECSQYQGQSLWQSGASEKESYIKNLQVEKEYISDQLISVEKDFEQLQNTYKFVSEEKLKLQEELQFLKSRNEELQKQLELSKEQENVLNDHISLMKQSVRILEGKAQQFKGMTLHNRSVELPVDGQVVTIQSMLAFFKKKELKQYHQALLDLINLYQQRISELNNAFKEQKQMKDKLLVFGRGLYSKVTSGKSLAYEDIVLQISKYEQVINYLHEDEIDILLRKIKCFSIGIDRNEYQNIRNELEEYVYQLKVRLPVLSEEYFQDGSSVADSFSGEPYEV